MKNPNKHLSNFIYITDPEILAIPIVECGEPLVDIKTETGLRYGPIPETELTKDCYTKIRKTVYEKLCKVQNDLPKGLYIRLYEGFRSLEVQQLLFEDVYQTTAKRLPNVTPAELFRETTRLVSPVINLDGTKNIPTHSTGGAVDVEIVTEEGELIDMGMEAKDWNNVDPDLCLTHCNQISKTAQANRLLLLKIMESHEFINYPTEWWHFSYGDRYWAYHQTTKQAIYGSADFLDF